MQDIIRYIKKNEITYKDAVIYYFIENNPNKTALQISKLLDCNYSRLTESLKVLIELKLIVKTLEKPVRFMINE